MEYACCSVCPKGFAIIILWRIVIKKISKKISEGIVPQIVCPFIITTVICERLNASVDFFNAGALPVSRLAA
jgi:hypothetical protein